MNQLTDLLFAVAFDVDFSDIQWFITEAETIEELTYGRDQEAAPVLH
jgi:hypothetical protein